MAYKVKGNIRVTIGSMMLVLTVSLAGLSGCSIKESSPSASADASALTGKDAVSESVPSAPTSESVTESTSSAEVGGDEKDEKAIRACVESFGLTLKNVLLDAPDAEITQNMEDNYAQYVTPDLLGNWKGNPSVRAAGRFASSPWPDHIEISSVVKNTDRGFSVTGTLVEVTGQVGQGGTTASTRSVDIKAIPSGGKWLISECFFGYAVPVNEK